ncbi:hypothetical protein [Chelativorans sp.]|uniref:hypothetical protein n=1 Tax=Chelativorans sp. TaxID=2203393 RepID=UPI00281114DE|nr:hypothetical protein [Chelativorans sp.]
MRLALIILGGVLLGGCGAASEPSVQEVLSVSEGLVEGRPKPFYVGRWAANEALCPSARWEITQTGLSTPAHAFCGFQQIVNSEGVYQIGAICSAEGEAAQYQLRISQAQSAGAVLVEGGPFEPAALVPCSAAAIEGAAGAAITGAAGPAGDQTSPELGTGL